MSEELKSTLETMPRTRLTIAEATELAVAALTGIGYSAEQANIIADHLVDAAACGYEFAGLPRILAIADERVRWAEPRPISTVHETPVSALIDGGSNVGYLVARHAVDVAIAKAAASGIAVVGAFNSFYSGRIGYYVERACKVGLVCLHTASAEASVVPYGGTKPVLGTNPLAVGVPHRDGQFIYDIGTASMMQGELQLMKRLGLDLPEGVALDQDGQPTRDPAEGLLGGILPFAGHKGYGLSLAIQVLGLVAGADIGREKLSDYAFFFVVFRPDLLRPADELQGAVAGFLDLVRQNPAADPAKPVRIPTERAHGIRAGGSDAGVSIDTRIFDAITRLAQPKA